MLILELITLLAIAISIGLLIYGYKRHKKVFAKNIFIIMGLWLVIYIGLLFTFSGTSRVKLLDLNQEKIFSGFYLDCHLSGKVTDVQTREKVNGIKLQKPGKNIFYLVTVKIQNSAKMVPLQLENTLIEIIDEKGREYAPLLDGKKVLHQSIGPNYDSITKELVFELPKEVSSPRLLITEGNWVERFFELFLIGDEDSLFHKRSYFQLNSPKFN